MIAHPGSRHQRRRHSAALGGLLLAGGVLASGQFAPAAFAAHATVATLATTSTTSTTSTAVAGEATEAGPPDSAPPNDATQLAVQALDAQFARQVDHRLALPLPEQARYMRLAQEALAQAGLADLPPQTLLVVDRSASVQAAFLVLATQTADWHWVGAAAVSTGKPGGFAHFTTPLGVFAHMPDQPDYRAAGSYNENHIRGYGVVGMRVYDFGWHMAQRTWGAGGRSPMRLAMHATDPERLEARLGSIASEGCIRIPASLNHFLDHYGVLDADYEAARAQGRRLRVLLPDRQPLPWPGRYLVVIDSGAQTRPAWSPAPGAKPPASVR